MREQPDVIVPALRKITAALIDFSARSVEAGAAGVFYAISGYATKKAMPEAVYRELLMPFDRQILSALPEAAWFNVLHLCGSHVNMDVARRLPVQAVSYSIHNRGNPSLAEARKLTHGDRFVELNQRYIRKADGQFRQHRQLDGNLVGLFVFDQPEGADHFSDLHQIVFAHWVHPLSRGNAEERCS